MLIHHPSVVKDGLILYTDAANSKSYPKTGTSWIDLKNKSIGTMSNCTFDSGSQGSVVFNGTSSMVYYPSNSNYSFGTGDFTLESYCQVNLFTNIRPIVQNDAVGTSSNNKWWLGYTSSTLRFGQHSTSNGATCPWSPSSGIWYHIAATRISGLMYLYINGVSQAVTSQSIMNGVSFSQNGLSIGAISTPYYLNGNISLFRMYNIGLNSNQILQNYNATKGRFGY